MKKMLSLLLASALTVSMLAGCGGGEQPAQDNVETRQTMRILRAKAKRFIKYVTL